MPIRNQFDTPLPATTELLRLLTSDLFVIPEADTVLWRYMNFSKFMDLIDRRALYFTRADKLQDTFEGTYSHATVGASKPDVWIRLAKAWPRFTCVNCWHMNLVESAAMWQIYLHGGEGVAIRSTYRRMVAALEETAEVVYAGKVKYIDYKAENIPDWHAFYPFFCKRKEFAHEQEFRLLSVRLPEISPQSGQPEFRSEPVRHGAHVSVDITQLIDAVHVSPDSPPWVYQLIESVCDRYGVEAPILQSSLDHDTPY